MAGGSAADSGEEWVLGYQPPLDPSGLPETPLEPLPLDVPSNVADGTFLQPPRISVSAKPSDGPVPLTVAFSVSVESGNVPPDVRYRWSTQDSIIRTDDPRLEHVFGAAGTYRVVCCAESASWARDTEPCSEAVVVAQGAGGTQNLPPVAFDGEYVADQDGSVELELRGADPENGELDFTLAGQPAHGTLGGLRRTAVNTAAVRYRPAAGFSGLDEVRFQVNDGVHTSPPATIQVVVFDDPTPPVLGNRVPQWPLKTDRVLYTADQIASARALCINDPYAGRVLQNIRRQAAYWMEKSEQQIRDLVPDSRVPRAFDVAVNGCPVHGTAVYAHGTYPWILDRENPFVVICPVGGERYPGNDFRSLYRSDFRDPRFLTGAYSDNGRGWLSPDGEKYWFAAYACHWNWYTTWLTAVQSLSRAYLLTGDRNYARKAIAFLDRFAEVYPGMDYSRQSRYGELLDGRYPGKVLNSVWETVLAQEWVICYDMVHDALTGDDPVSLPWRSAAEIRANIEANLLEEIIDAVGRGQIRGNYGMHQRTLAFAAAVRQHGPTDQLVSGILHGTGGHAADEGLRYGLYNLVSKDGFPNETSPFYNAIRTSSIVQMSVPLMHCGHDILPEPRVRALLEAPLKTLCAGLFTPALGDAGSIAAGWIVPQASTFDAAYRAYGEPAFAWALVMMNAVRDQVGSFDEIFQPVQASAVRAAAATFDPRRESRFFDGYGLTILNNAADTLGVSLHYGPTSSHAHRDGLGVEIFGHGRRASPDLGYPDAMNDFVPGIYSWSRNTISHNCVVVDDRMQSASPGGSLLRFHETPFVHVADALQTDAYPMTDVYRRTLMLVDVGPDDGYLVDVFRVRGGSDHVLSLHGMEGTFELTGVTLSSPVTQGTYAGPSVAYGALYDDPVLGAAGYPGPFGSYAGSGYQHLFNWQAAIADRPTTATWTATGEPPARLRVHLPASPGQQVVVADAYVSPQRRVPTVLKYVLLRRTAGSEGSTFVCVWEISNGVPIIDAVEIHDDPSLGVGSGRIVALSVHRGSAVDTIVIADEPARLYSFSRSGPNTRLASDAAVLLMTETDGVVSRAFAAGGTGVNDGATGLQLQVPSAVRGGLVFADYGQARVVVGVQVNQQTADSLVGRMVRIYNDRRSCAYTVAGAQTGPGTLILTLGGSDVLTGRVQLRAVDPAQGLVHINTTLPNPARLAGMTLITGDLTNTVRIEEVQGSAIRVAAGSDITPFLAALQASGTSDGWISDFGPGDLVEIERSVRVEY